MKKKKKKGVLGTLLLILIFLIGLSLLLYPTFSEWWNRTHQSHAIVAYQEAVGRLSEADKAAMLAAAEAYNGRLFALYCGEDIDLEALQAEYKTLLNVYDKGMMGVVEIPRIGVNLPIYHGTDETSLQAGVGHFDTSSLPVGGLNTHCIISGHTGLPSARLFTDLEQMVVGDEFTIEVLGRRMTYVVDRIVVALPWEMEYLDVVSGKDYVTLLTCTPYGENSHRLLVRGVRTRTAAPEESQEPAPTEAPQAEQPEQTETNWMQDPRAPFCLLAGLSVVIGLMLIVSALLQRRKKRKRAQAKEQNQKEEAT